VKYRPPVAYDHPYMPPRPMPRDHRPARRVLALLGVLCILGGMVLIAVPLYGVLQRAHADQSALNSWNSGGSDAVKGAAPAGGPVSLQCGSSSSSDVALVEFNVPGYSYAGVAGDGTWDMLHQRSMVHYDTTPQPGQEGNVIIAFHREPNYEHIDQLNPGTTVAVQDRSCHTFHYRITQKWTLDPSQVTQLVPQPGQHVLTLITCTPFWVDTQRLVWRAELVS
jgi:sortase A